LYLLLTGALAQTTVSALLRRDAPALLAMGIATLVAGHVADLPRPLLIWGCAIMLLILVAALIGALARLVLAKPWPQRIGVAASVILLAGLWTSAPDASRDLLPHPLAAGAELSVRIDALVRS
jgi:Na+/citrate or Na+/malate symporter